MVILILFLVVRLILDFVLIGFEFLFFSIFWLSVVIGRWLNLYVCIVLNFVWVVLYCIEVIDLFVYKNN